MKYLLLSSRRSGSALLKHSLINLFDENDDGPDEWIVSPITRKNFDLPEDFDLAKKMVLNNPDLLIDKMTPDTHRKVMYSQLIKVSNLPLNVPVIHLIRKDSWSQAKSAWIMKQKMLPAHVNKESFDNLIDKSISLRLDFDEIEMKAKNMLFQKHYWYQAMKNRPNTLTLYYEDDLCDFSKFVRNTIPRIEAFLKKKPTIEGFEYPLRKTSSLYTIENLDEYNEQKIIDTYYFNQNKVSLKDFIKVRIKLALKK